MEPEGPQGSWPSPRQLLFVQRTWTCFKESLRTLKGVECGLQTLESDDSKDFQGRALRKVCDKLEGSPVLNYLEHFSS